MIAIRVKAKRRTAEATPIGEPGSPVAVDILWPEGLEDRLDWCATKPLVEDEEQVVFVSDDAVPEGDPRRLKPADLPARDDLPGALKGKRLLSVVPSGWGNCTLDAKGRLVPVDAKGDPIAVEGEPVAAPLPR